MYVPSVGRGGLGSSSQAATGNRDENEEDDDDDDDVDKRQEELAPLSSMTLPRHILHRL